MADRITPGNSVLVSHQKIGMDGYKGKLWHHDLDKDGKVDKGEFFLQKPGKKIDQTPVEGSQALKSMGIQISRTGLGPNGFKNLQSYVTQFQKARESAENGKVKSTEFYLDQAQKIDEGEDGFRTQPNPVKKLKSESYQQSIEKLFNKAESLIDGIHVLKPDQLADRYNQIENKLYEAELLASEGGVDFPTEDAKTLRRRSHFKFYFAYDDALLDFSVSNEKANKYNDEAVKFFRLLKKDYGEENLVELFRSGKASAGL